MISIKECIRKIIADEIGKSITDDTKLFENGLDSLGTLRVLTFIEDILSIEIPDDELVLENFETIDALVQMVSKYVENN